MWLFNNYICKTSLLNIMLLTRPNTLKYLISDTYNNIAAAELEENNEFITVRFELPGINQKELDIELTDTTISLSGERKKKDDIVNSELYYGKFKRVIKLPSRVKNDEAIAEYKDGILSVTIPKIMSSNIFKIQL